MFEFDEGAVLNESNMISKESSFDTFDRYKFPILKTYKVIELTYPITWIIMDSDPTKYLISEKQSIHKDSRLSSETLCKSNFVSILKPDQSRSVYVKSTTAEKLVTHGWIM